MSKSTALAEALGNTAITALPADQVTTYLTQRLTQVRVQLLEATVNRQLTLVSSDVPQSAQDSQVEQFNKQIQTLHACIDALEGALAASPTPAATPAAPTA